MDQSAHVTAASYNTVKSAVTKDRAIGVQRKQAADIAAGRPPTEFVVSTANMAAILGVSMRRLQRHHAGLLKAGAMSYGVFSNPWAFRGQVRYAVYIKSAVVAYFVRLFASGGTI